MVNATVDNTAVAISLSASQSTTVPSNETWKVTITARPSSTSVAGDGSNITNALVSIDGITVAGSESRSSADTQAPNATATANSTVPFDTVLTGGETVSASGGGVRIGGFVVSN